MRRYETIVIIDPDLSEDDRKTHLERTKTLISDQDGFLVLEDDWGSRKLAYEIKKKARGYYVRLDYCGTGALVREMERLFRIDDRVLKFMTVQLEDLVDVERLKSELAEAEKNAAAEEEAAETPAEAGAEEETPEEAEAEKETPEEPETVSDAEPEEKADASEEPVETESTATESTDKE